MTKRIDRNSDPDETRGRAMYRAIADKEARMQMALAHHMPRVRMAVATEDRAKSPPQGAATAEQRKEN